MDLARHDHWNLYLYLSLVPVSKPFFSLQLYYPGWLLHLHPRYKAAPKGNKSAARFLIKKKRRNNRRGTFQRRKYWKWVIMIKWANIFWLSNAQIHGLHRLYDLWGHLVHICNVLWQQTNLLNIDTKYYTAFTSKAMRRVIGKSSRSVVHTTGVRNENHKHYRKSQYYIRSHSYLP